MPSLSAVSHPPGKIKTDYSRRRGRLPKSNSRVTFQQLIPRSRVRAYFPHKPQLEKRKSMRTIRTFIVLLFLTAVSFAASARADSYSWSNLQSDIAGAALHTDRDLVNPWGLAASSGGTIWVADNGTGVSTLYRQDGSKNPLVVTIPTSARNKNGGNPTGVVFNGTAFFK